MGKAGSSGGSSSSSLMHMARARMLLMGHQGTGQQQLGAAVLAALEGLPVHCIGLTSLLANAAARYGGTRNTLFPRALPHMHTAGRRVPLGVKHDIDIHTDSVCH
jgi:hypothetical protein